MTEAQHIATRTIVAEQVAEFRSRGVTAREALEAMGRAYDSHPSWRRARTAIAESWLAMQRRKATA